ncbi:Protein-glutamate O-methyltransferase [Trametes pubescens]|uniref:Sugar phosphate phosphatase n=1 Tax=Trametes pubescens TaxID=154538 RepID=A0A1M2VXK6_TRAPU|nr:Protein-glutamate O-methyltransferase [Trametes pubescens]
MQRRGFLAELATTMHELEKDKDSLAANPENLKVIFEEMVEMCLWGNATDLSMLTHLSHEQIQHLQSVGRDAQAARAEFILRDDQEKVWDHLKSFAGKTDSRIDFVLDNGGFELFTDFVFADFLVTYTPYASKVVFHPKLIPWFVSDVTPPDFRSTTKSLLSPSFFPQEATPEGAPATDSSEESRAHLYKMVKRWESYIDSGVFALSVPIDSPLGASDKKANFWTTPYPYWNMKELAPELHKSLSDSSLVIFKGDLNFRKLTGDVQWPTSTPFETAIGPLAGSFPILSLRTNKADVIVAIDDEVAEKLESSGEKWRYNGKYAVVLFQPRSE